MKKIPTVFVRDFSEPSKGRYVTEEINPGCEWVFAGEGVPTRKYDGTCLLLDEKGWWARREVKSGKQAPPYYRPVETDEVTGKQVGWEPVDQSAFIEHFREAFEADRRHDGVAGGYRPGTFELIGPKVNGNPAGVGRHVLPSHAEAEVLEDNARDFETLRARVCWLGDVEGTEGIVWHHPDGRMAKLKRRDFFS